jgi:hypothetical protein
VLTQQGEELTFSHSHVSEQGAARNYLAYIQMAREFGEWAFMSEQEVLDKENRERS